MHSINIMNRRFLINQIRQAKYQHTLIIGYLHHHVKVKGTERMQFLKDISYYRRVVKSCIKELRNIIKPL